MSKTANDRLISLDEAARQLGVSRRTFYRRLPLYRANGLVPIKYERQVQFRASNVQEVIDEIFEQARLNA